MLGTNLTWEKIFEQTDRDINLQRVMNAMVYGKNTGQHDWIPDRAIGPIDNDLYDAEKDYHDQELSRFLEKSPTEIQNMTTGEKRANLMNHKKEQLHQLIQAIIRSGLEHFRNTDDKHTETNRVVDIPE